MAKSSRPYAFLSWLPVAALWLLARLPHGLALALGRGGGLAYYRLSRRRVRYARTNLGLCFPELGAAAREDLLRRHFASLGQGIAEMGMAWWGDVSRPAAGTRIDGLEHLQRAAAGGRGVILLSAHFTSLELGGRLLSRYHDFAVVYRRNENPVLERVIRGRRAALFIDAIPRDNIKGMLRALKQGHAVWFAPDQHPNRRSAVFAPFFGTRTLTSTATARIARLSGAPVVPFFPSRLAGGGYVLRILPPLDNFPANDDANDAARLNGLFEQAIREAPEQYLWTHRRFKTIEGDVPNPYR